MQTFYLSLFFCSFCLSSIFAQNEPQTKIIEVPAEYQTITKKVLAKEGGFTDWVEVVCENQQLQNDILKMKIALKDLGYDVDTLQSKDIIDTKTRKALTQFQKDYEVPSCCGYGSCIPKYLFEAHQEFLNQQN